MKPGEIVQLNPFTCRNPMFRGCMMVVTEVKPWGAQGYVQGLGNNGEPAGQAYYRARHDEMVPTGGMAFWVAGSLAEEGKEE
jgi:hypothetical protein